jgi:putative transposase
VGSVRRELLDRVLIVNAAHLRKVLAEYETYFNGHRPHRALNQASPLRALPDPLDADIEVIRRDRLGGMLHEYPQVA